MRKKQFILTLAAIALLFIFFVLPQNKQWAGRVYSYFKDYQRQRDTLDIEDRMRKRFGNNYVFSKQIADMFEKRGTKEQVLVLMPPSSYFTRMGVQYHVPEPAVFYYYTGLKTIWANSNDAIKANWYVHANGNLLMVYSVTDVKAFSDTIAAFKKLGPSL